MDCRFLNMPRKRKLDAAKSTGGNHVCINNFSQARDEDIVFCFYEAFIKVEYVKKRLADSVDSVHRFYAAC